MTRPRTSAGSADPDGARVARLPDDGLQAAVAEERSSPGREDLLRILIAAESDIVVTRNAARDLAAGLAFSPTDLTGLATAVSELCRNIVRFAGSGEVVAELLEDPRPGVRVIARDRGPGIADLEWAMRDGVSSYGGLGLGLPGVRRLMDDFDIVTERGVGTTVVVTAWEKPRRPPGRRPGRHGGAGAPNLDLDRPCRCGPRDSARRRPPGGDRRRGVEVEPEPQARGFSRIS